MRAKSGYVIIYAPMHPSCYTNCNRSAREITENMRSRNNYLMFGDDSIQKNEKITIFNSNEDTSLHKHDFVELVYFKSGTGKHYIDGKTFNISNGDICLINTGVEHYYTINNEARGAIAVKNCIFYSDFFGEQYHSDNFILEIWKDLFPSKLPEASVNFIQINGDYNKDYLSLINIIENEIFNRRPGYLSIIKDCLTSMLIKIFRDYWEATNEHPISSKNIDLLEQSITYIRQNAASNLLLEDVAGTIHFSTVYYNKLLKLYTGMTFNKFLQKTRCELAGEMLKETNETVASICGKVGYNDLKHFFMLFKKYMGTTPYNYRKKYLTDLQSGMDR